MQIAVHYLSVGPGRWVKLIWWMSSGNVNLFCYHYILLKVLYERIVIDDTVNA